ncbi:MAG: hypothetical protein K1000chlam2_00413 [Chlamydiae bacterium]|nr:hypothetical protein [Chlamydiota bacterium]
MQIPQKNCRYFLRKYRIKWEKNKTGTACLELTLAAANHPSFASPYIRTVLTSNGAIFHCHSSRRLQLHKKMALPLFVAVADHSKNGPAKGRGRGWNPPDSLLQPTAASAQQNWSVRSATVFHTGRLREGSNLAKRSQLKTRQCRFHFLFDILWNLRSKYRKKT